MLKVVFVSGVKLGYDCLRRILEIGFKVEHVFSYPENLSERSGYVDFSQICDKYGVGLTKTGDINSKNNVDVIERIAPDVILVIGWSSIIGKEILSIPKLGVIGHHPTLLPKHRGNAPIPWTLINGLTKSGITLMFLENEIDKGDILIQKEFDVELEDDAASIYEKATLKTIDALTEILPKLESGNYERIPQDPKRASVWKKRRPEDGIIDWNSMSICIYNWIRGNTYPYPGAFTFVGDRKLFVWKARISGLEIAVQGMPPGKMVCMGDKLFVKTGDGILEILCLNFEGDEEMDASKFIKSGKCPPEGLILG